jgi:hypothetical protein
MSTRRESPPIRKAREWEYKNLVHGKGYYDKSKGYHRNLRDNMASRGYDAMRVSPQTTTRHGHKYRAVYGASVEPDYSRPARDRPKQSHRYGAKVEWHKQGYVKATKKQRTGTTPLHSLRDYPVDAKEARYKLMMKAPAKRRRPKRRR